MLTLTMTRFRELREGDKTKVEITMHAMAMIDMICIPHKHDTFTPDRIVRCIQLTR
jgi:hypothetical protein